MDRYHSIDGPMVSYHWKPLKNHRVQWLPDYKTIEKPLVPLFLVLQCCAWLLATFPTLWHRWKLIVFGPEGDYEQQYVSCCLECMPNQKNLLAVIIDNHFGCLCLRRTTMPVTLLLAASFNWWRGPTQFLSLTEEKENNMRRDLSITQY